MVLCGKLTSISNEKGWYYTTTSAGKLKHIAAWMREEDKLKEEHEKAAEAIAEALEPLEDTMQSSTTVMVDDDEHEDNSSDDDC